MANLKRSRLTPEQKRDILNNIDSFAIDFGRNLYNGSIPSSTFFAIQNDEKVMRALIEREPSNLVFLPAAFPSYSPKVAPANIAIAIETVTDSPAHIHYLPEWAKDNQRVMLGIVKTDGLLIKYANYRIKRLKSVCLAAARQNIGALDHMCYSIRHSIRQIIMTERTHTADLLSPLPLWEI